MRTPVASLGALREEARALSFKEAVKEIADAYERNDLLTAASAIAFQVLFALVPFTLFCLGLMGGLRLEELYREEVAPALRDSTSVPAFSVIDDTVRKVLDERQFFWITIGAAITVWEMSGATRAVMGVFDRIYECDEERGFVARYGVSIWLSVATGLCMLAAFVVFAFGSELVGGWMSFARWPIAIVLLLAAIALFVRYAPSDHQPLNWVSFGAVLIVVAWLGASIAFALYVRNIADYGSIFGALATVMILMGYLYLSAVAFLTGAQVDALVRQRLAESTT